MAIADTNRSNVQGALRVGFDRCGCLLGKWRCATLPALPQTALHTLLATMFMAIVNEFQCDPWGSGKSDPEDLVRATTKV